MRVLSAILVAVAIVASACTAEGTRAPESGQDLAPTTRNADPSYEIVDHGELVLADAEEDWCNTIEGSAGAWLVANERNLIVDPSSGEPFTIDPDAVQLLETVVSEGHTAISPDEFEELDTFLRFPIPSPLACRTAFETRSR